MSNNNNNWIAHVKAFAAQKNISYACAVSMPECKATYKKEEVVKPVKEKKTKKQKKETKKIKIINKNILEAVALTPKKRKIIIKKKPEEALVVSKPIKETKEKKEKLTSKQIIKIIRKIRKSMTDQSDPIDKTMFKSKSLFFNALKRFGRRRGIIVPDLENKTQEERKDYIENKLKVDLNELAEIQNNEIDRHIYDIIKKKPDYKNDKNIDGWTKFYIKPNELKTTLQVEDEEED